MTKIYEDKMDQAVKHLEGEFRRVRAGRANPGVLDRVTVEYYGVPTPVAQVASVSTADARTLVITPWDRSILKEINKAILTSDIGINPTDDGSCIRLVFPAPTEERRKELVKEVSKMAEEAKVAVRNVRRDALDKFKTQKKNSEITEDDLKNLVKNIDDITAKKSKEVMEVLFIFKKGHILLYMPFNFKFQAAYLPLKSGNCYGQYCNSQAYWDNNGRQRPLGKK